MHPPHTFPPYFPEIHSNIILPSTPRSSEWSLKGSYQENCKIIGFPHRYNTLILRMSEVHTPLSCVIFQFITACLNVFTLVVSSSSSSSSSSSRDSLVGIALGYRCYRIRFPAETGNFSLHHRVQTGSGAHPASYPTCAGDSFPGVKGPGREADHSPPSNVEIKECVEIYFHSPYTSSWRGT